MSVLSSKPDLRRRTFEIIEIGAAEDAISRGYDIFNLCSIVINLTTCVLNTFDGIQAAYGDILLTLEAITVAFFAMDFLLRAWTAKILYPQDSEIKALLKYMVSFKGLVDICSFLPYYLPIFFPTGAVAFRLFRLMRFFRLFRINAYYDSFNVITEVIMGKRQQLISSVFIILVLMLASSLCMYSLENQAQPHVFTNAFSGIWWAVSTLLTIGYGDIYPVTTMGKLFSIVITFLGVGMVAIPTGIISAGFVDQYSQIKRITEYACEKEIDFIKVHLSEEDSWSGQSVMNLRLPHGIIVAAIQRKEEVIVPRGDVVLCPDDILILGTLPPEDEIHINLKEITLRQQHPWNGQRIRDLDISRQTIIVMVKRNNTAIIPHGSLVLQEGDLVVLYSKVHINYDLEIEI